MVVEKRAKLSSDSFQIVKRIFESCGQYELQQSQTEYFTLGT